MKGRGVSAVRRALVKERSGLERSMAYVTCGLTLTAVMLTVCVVIRPESLSVDFGVSYMGIHANTIVPYAVALLGAAYCVWRASESMVDSDHSLITGWAMRIIAVQLVGLLLTPYTRFGAAHEFIGSTLFLVQLGLALLAIKWLGGGDRSIPLLTGVMFLSGLAAAYYLPRSQGFELEAQVGFQMAFWFLFTRVLRGLQLQPATADVGVTGVGVRGAEGPTPGETTVIL
ncbi:MAG: hypothetical protein ABSA40_01230 [Candidatus Dormibacteria bacterium]